MAIEGDNLEPELLHVVQEDADVGSFERDQNQRGHGHYFVKKVFGKPTYCHHCCELLWGILSQGYICEICNFTCHEKCLNTVASFCSGVAMQLIKNPVAHCWSEPAYIKRKFCCVCRKKTDDILSVECEVCEYYVHVFCQDLAVSDCKEAGTFIGSLEPATQKQHHHWREGNLPAGSKCAVCRKTCWSAECLAGMRCEWCGVTAHAICYRQISPDCDFGMLRQIMLPPNCLTAPRTELPMEQLLSIKCRDKDPSTPPNVQIPEDSGSSANEETGRDKEDYETLHIFDGNESFKNNRFRSCTILRMASVREITKTALRTFHIHDSPKSYYISCVNEEEEISEQLLEDLEPLKNLVRKPNSRLCFFLRSKDPNPEKLNLKVYGSWLRIPITFCTVSVDCETTVEDIITEAMTQFGILSVGNNIYDLVEVSLERGVVERTLSLNEKMFQLLQAQKNNSLKQFLATRYYLQEKEDPNGLNVCIFVGNLPPTLTQRQYERILLRLLGAEERPFTAIGPIYFEYGSLLITFNSPKAATKACLKLQSATYDDKRLLVLCLPNIQPHMIPKDVEPLMVLVNVRSGGCQGLELIRCFRKLLNPFQVFDILNGGPLVGLYVFRNIRKYKILVCGGDGTVGWVLQCLDIVGQDSVCSSPPCGIVPLGTGNDLARVLRWGSGYSAQEEPLQILKDVIDAEEVRLDRWTVVFHPLEPSELPSSSEQNPDTALQMSNPEDQTSMIIMNNYYGIGLDADVCLGFDKARKSNPDKFNSRIHNKGVYARIGLKKMVNRKMCKDIQRKVKLEVDGKPIDLPNLEGLIILNIMSWGSGANPWGPEKEEPGFSKPNHYDGLLEVIGVTGIVHLGQMQAGFSSGLRIAQGTHIKISTTAELPVQIDGEPQLSPPGKFTILKSALKATMLKKSKTKRRFTDPAMTGHYQPTVKDTYSSAPPSSPTSMQMEPDDDFV